MMHTNSDRPEPVLNGPGAKGAVAEAASGATREFHNFVTDVEELITATTSLTGEDLARAKAKLRERVAAAKASVEALGGDIAHQARRTATATNDYVRENPWKAVGIGAAAGLLLGFVLTRRH